MLRVATTSDIKRALLDAIRACGAGWHDRVAIAQQMGKNYPNASETTILELLVETGQIEKALQPTNRPHILRTVYRLKE